jgi:hypothetical protein
MSSVVIKQSLVPMITFYIVIMVVLAVGLLMSRRAARQGGSGTVRGASRAGGPPPASPSSASPSPASPSPASTGDASGSLSGATGASAPGTGATLASATPRSAPASGLERARGPRTLLRPGPGWPRLAVKYARTVIGGYLLLMAVVVIYYFGVARVGGNFIESAFTGCALLVGLTTPVFFLISWLTTRRS